MAVATIEIRLESDLCAGSGQGFTHVIDSDVCYCKHGIPFIPARRIKGVLRDAAVYIGKPQEVIDAIFGVSGNKKKEFGKASDAGTVAAKAEVAKASAGKGKGKKPAKANEIKDNTDAAPAAPSETLYGALETEYTGVLKIQNARIEGYEELSAACENDPLDASAVLRLFTRTKAQTELVNGVANRNSLRLTRIVNQYSPLTEESLVFYAKCEVPSKYKNDMIDICKASRNMGLDRTRGLGAVRFSFIPDKGTGETNNPDNKSKGSKRNTEECRLAYKISLQSPIMLPSASNDETVKYISGTTIMGALASKYRQLPDKSEEEFEDLFLSNKVRYSNAYVEETIPAPMFINKVKQTEEQFITYERPDLKGKTLKNGFVHKDTFKEIKVLTEIVYHQRRDKNALLYTQKCICAGQWFTGEIIGERDLLTRLNRLLRKGISLGRSRSAEYAACTVEVGKLESTSAVKENTLAIEQNEVMAAVFLSDLICLDDCGSSTTDLGIVFESLGVPGKIDEERTFMDVKRVVGYSGVWNLKKPHFIAIAAGSVITFTYGGEEKELPAIRYCGEKNNEGFGKVRFYKVKDLSNWNSKPRETQVPEKARSSIYDALKAKLYEQTESELIRVKAVEFAESNRAVLESWTQSFASRVLLMAKQSVSLSDFELRIESIRTKGKRISAQNLLKAFKEMSLAKDYKPFFILTFSLAKYWLRNVEGSDNEGRREEE
ncbi:MAG: hypothetical protein LBC41_01525 [Clostridiales bacterium]|nr:hypothetical protein [Clostridiales bacterium]